MEKSTVLHKTAKGLEEIKASSHNLPQKLRTLLIVVNGKSTVGDLLARFSAFPDIEQSIDTLLKDGFIQATETTADESVVDDVARVEAVRALCRALYDAVGPDADTFTARIEAARDRAEFQAALEGAIVTMEALAGKQKTRRFAEQAEIVASMFSAA